MTRREIIFEHYESACFAVLMDRFVDTESERLNTLVQSLDNAPNAMVPESMNAQDAKFINACFAKLRRKAAGKSARKAVKIAVILVAIMAALFTVAFAYSDTFRVNTLNLIIEVLDDRTNLTFGEATANAGTGFTIHVGWIPDGFSVQDQRNGAVESWIQYMNPQEAFFDITVMDGNGTTASCDTEDAEVSNIVVQHRTAMYIEKNDTKQIVWADEENGMFVQLRSYYISKEVMIQIAENLAIMRDDKNAS